MHLKIPVISIKYTFYILGIFSYQHLFILWDQMGKKTLLLEIVCLIYLPTGFMRPLKKFTSKRRLL